MIIDVSCEDSNRSNDQEKCRFVCIKDCDPSRKMHTMAVLSDLHFAYFIPLTFSGTVKFPRFIIMDLHMSKLLQSPNPEGEKPLFRQIAQ